MTRDVLAAHHDAQRQLNEARELYRTMRLMAYPGAQNLDGMPKAPADTKSKVEELALVLADLSDQIEILKDRVKATQPAVLAWVHEIEEPQPRMICALRVLCGLTWERVGYFIGISQDSARMIYWRIAEKL